MEWINKPNINGEGVSIMNQCKKRGCPSQCIGKCDKLCPDKFCFVVICPRN